VVVLFISFMLCCIMSLACWDSSIEEIRNTHPLSLSCTLGIWAQSPFAVSGALHNLDDEKAKVPGMTHIIPGAGSEPSL
jgi:hypothetical protein